MIQYQKEAETANILNVAQSMCTAARTAPKTKGDDYIVTAIVTGEEKDQLADKMEELSEPLKYGFFMRDADNIRNSQAIVLIGVKNKVRGLNDGCGYCNFKNCGDCMSHGAMCAYGPIDLGIAVGSAASVAANNRVDNRVMFSAGRVAMEMGIFEEDVKDVLGIPLSASGKSPYFDRKPKK